jgi:ABC-type glycerol-3-phosphate transport system substrate-binding protein
VRGDGIRPSDRPRAPGPWPRRHWGLLLGATAACGSGGGGGSNEQQQVTIRFEWWGNADREEITERAIDLFEQKNPKIKVETSFASSTRTSRN